MQLIRDSGEQARLVKVDMRNRASIRNLCAETYKAFGRVDILLNNAAMQFSKLFFDYTEEEYDWLMQVNLKGYWRCIQEALPYMKKSGHGRIINLASIHAQPRRSHCISKVSKKWISFNRVITSFIFVRLNFLRIQ
ncbi:hypothetical protein FACS1894130_06420 [Spirochaetia bacterium]|nr:hypothetical protein FACS1894130_06420 [Spirochaetia bacterium]